MGSGGELSGKVAIVTGGSRGIGRSIARGLARAGASVVVASRKADRCVEVAGEIEAETGRATLGVGCHVGRWAECDALVERAYERFGRVDLLVNNAGMSPRYPSLAEVGEELYDKVMAVNLKGPFRLSSLLGTRMAAGEGGAILNISSIAAVQPTPVEVPYGAAKAGLHNLTLSMARAFAPRVRVNCIMPGPFLTDISKAWPESFHEGLRRMVPLQRGGDPDEVTDAALYLLGDKASFVTGAILKIDGGAAYPAA